MSRAGIGALMVLVVGFSSACGAHSEKVAAATKLAREALDVLEGFMKIMQSDGAADTVCADAERFFDDNKEGLVKLSVKIYELQDTMSKSEQETFDENFEDEYRSKMASMSTLKIDRPELFRHPKCKKAGYNIGKILAGR